MDQFLKIEKFTQKQVWDRKKCDESRFAYRSCLAKKKHTLTDNINNIN